MHMLRRLIKRFGEKKRDLLMVLVDLEKLMIGYLGRYMARFR